jgi:hypothetical protein
MTLAYIFEGTEVFSYEKNPTAEDVADYLGCDPEQAEAIDDGEELPDLPTKDDLLEESDFVNYMQNKYRWDAYREWEDARR